MAWIILLLALQDIDSQIEALSSDDPGERDRATAELVKAGVKAVPAVERLLGSEDPEAASRAEAILREIGVAAVPILDDSESQKARAISQSIVVTKAREYLERNRIGLTGTADYSVEMKDAPVWKGVPELEIGTGTYSIGSLNWYRFLPTADRVDVLYLGLKCNANRIRGGWPPDTASPTIQRAILGVPEYKGMLRVLAAMGAAKVDRQVGQRGGWGRGSLIWDYVFVSDGQDVLLRDEYVGNETSSDIFRYAKVAAAAQFAFETVTKLDIKDAEITPEERAWVSRKVGRDSPPAEWVRERYIILAGAAGDESALPTLAAILESKESRELALYYAINAVTRLTGQDVRDKPVETMNVQAVREKVLEMLRQRK